MARLPDPSRKRLVILTGARQTGKTTLVKAAYPDLHYVNLETIGALSLILFCGYSQKWVLPLDPGRNFLYISAERRLSYE